MEDPGSPDWIARILATTILLILGGTGFRSFNKPRFTAEDIARLESENEKLRGQMAKRDEREDQRAKRDAKQGDQRAKREAERDKREAERDQTLRGLEERGRAAHKSMREEEERRNPGQLVQTDAMAAMETYLIAIDNERAEADQDTPV